MNSFDKQSVFMMLLGILGCFLVAFITITALDTIAKKPLTYYEGVVQKIEPMGDDTVFVIFDSGKIARVGLAYRQQIEVQIGKKNTIAVDHYSKLVSVKVAE